MKTDFCHRLVKFICPWIVKEDRFSKLSTEAYNTLQEAQVCEDPKEAYRKIQRFKELEREMHKEDFKFKYKMTSNKGNYALWFIWWFNLSSELYKLVTKEGEIILRLTMIVLAIVCLFWYCRIMIENDRKRKELFLEAI